MCFFNTSVFFCREEEHILNVSENRVLKIIFGSKSKVGFVVDKMALGQVFSEYFCFPCQSSFHQLLHNHPHLSSGLYNRPEVAAVPGDVSPTPQKKKEQGDEEMWREALNNL
jgi:hypothetical protein